MILAETSGWVEYLRNTTSPVSRAMRSALGGDGVVTCDPVRLEVLAGALDERHADRLRALLARVRVLETSSGHYDEAAGLYQLCRRRGVTIRSLLDCLIAAVAIDHRVPVLHADRDFDLLARHTALRVVDPLDLRPS